MAEPYVFNPSPTEKALLWLVRQHESSQNYTAANPLSSAEGAYQDITSTWTILCNLAGYSVVQYPDANSAPAAVQDICNLILLRLYGANSSKSWEASGPYPKYTEVQGMLAAAGVVNP
jgi:hypothetical protein